MNSILLSTVGKTAELSTAQGYIAGIVIAAILLIYLIYSLLKPEKF